MEKLTDWQAGARPTKWYNNLPTKDKQTLTQIEGKTKKQKDRNAQPLMEREWDSDWHLWAV